MARLVLADAGSLEAAWAADHRQYGLIRLLSHTHLPHERERQRSPESGVTNQPKHCRPSAEHQPESIKRRNTAEGGAGGGSNPRPADYESAPAAHCVSIGVYTRRLQASLDG